MTEKNYTLIQAAKRLKTSEYYTRKLIASGKLKSTKVNFVRVITESDILEFLDTNGYPNTGKSTGGINLSKSLRRY